MLAMQVIANLGFCRVQGMAGALSITVGGTRVRDFYPIDYLPQGVRLTAYGGDASDLPARVLQDFLDAVAGGTAVVPIAQVFRFDQIVEAHAAMDANTASGKLVVTT